MPNNSTQARRELLWFNSKIKCDGRALFEKSMYLSGVKHLDDIVGARGEIMSYHAFKQKFPECRTNFLRYFGITCALPTQWKLWLTQMSGAPVRVNERNAEACLKKGDKVIPISRFATRDFYKFTKRVVTPTAVQRWEYQGIHPQSWPEVFYIPYKCTKSTKLQAFQYQIIHRYIPTRKFLHIRGVVDSPTCLYCDCNDSMVHYFYACRAVRTFWIKVFDYINSHIRPYHVLYDVKNVLFGVLDGSPIVNLMLLLGKHYLYGCKLKEKAMVFDKYIAYVKNVYETEKCAALRCEKMTANVTAKWNLFARGLMQGAV